MNTSVYNSVGTCYEDAWRILIKEEEGELIHGTVESLGRRIGHAWVELPTGFIWEPESRQFIKKTDFKAMAKPQEEARYSVTEAAIMLARVGKHGPWTEQERQMLKRGNPNLEPWQMTKEDFAKVYLERFKSMLSKGAFSRVTKEELQRERDEAIDYHKHTIRQALATGRPVPPEVLRDYPELEGSNPARVHFDRADIDSAIEAAKRLKSEKDLYIFATYLGYTIESRPPPGSMQSYVIVRPDGSTETVKPLEVGNPDDFQTQKELEDKRAMEQASRLYWPKEVTMPRTEEERKSIHERIFGKGAPLERLGRGQTVNNLLPMPPEEGPPLPRIIALKWPWRK